MLTVKDLTVAYADTPVFADVAVHFNAGKITGIIGPNGAGKSTLIKAIFGIDQGTIRNGRLFRPDTQRGTAVNRLCRTT